MPISDQDDDSNSAQSPPHSQAAVVTKCEPSTSTSVPDAASTDWREQVGAVVRLYQNCFTNLAEVIIAALAAF